MPIKSFLDLEVYQLAHKFAMKVFEITRTFPNEERFALTDQLRRSSRSIAGNTAEGWGKRVYINSFKRHLIDANGSLEESKAWLLFAKDCKYITEDICNELFKDAEVIGTKLCRLHDTWKDFSVTSS
jgi:four helix bundle protein